MILMQTTPSTIAGNDTAKNATQFTFEEQVFLISLSAISQNLKGHGIFFALRDGNYLHNLGNNPLIGFCPSADFKKRTD